MAEFSLEVLRAATQRLERRRTLHEEEYARRREEVYRRAPRVQVLDRLLRANVTRAAAAAFRSGGDTAGAISALRDQSAGLRREREELLRGLGYAPDALDGKPICPRCGDRGWRGMTMCECLKALCQEEQVKQRTSLMSFRGQSFEQFRSDLYPPRSRGEMTAVYQFCRLYARSFPGSQPRNLLFTGAPGLGKTFLSVCIAREVGERGYSVVYDSAIHIFDRMEAAKFDGDGEARQESVRYASCDLLILDDLGSELTVPSVQSSLYYLVNTRLLEDRHTIVSTNLSPEELSQRYSPQVCSRLTGDYQIFPFVGEDLRPKANPYVQNEF